MVARGITLLVLLAAGCGPLAGDITGYEDPPAADDSGDAPDDSPADDPSQPPPPPPPGPPPPPPSEPQTAPATRDGLSINGLSQNRLSLNRLSLNALSSDKLTLSGQGLEATPEGRELLKYIIRCALPEGQALGAVVGPSFYLFHGGLGFAPEWLEDDCEEDCQRWISGCLLAHVNALGVSVPISVRAPDGMITSSAEELTEYNIQEGAFWGDIFVEEGEPLVMNACEGWGLTGNGNDDDPSTWISKRLCAEDEEACGFVSAGPCGQAQWGQPACAPEGPTGSPLTGCKAKGAESPVYQEVVTIYLPQ